MSEGNQDLPNEAITALERGSKIEAIKCVRIAHKIGLKEAKEAVELFIESNPDLKNRMHRANVEAAKGSYGRFFLILAIVAVAAYYFLR